MTSELPCLAPLVPLLLRRLASLLVTLIVCACGGTQPSSGSSDTADTTDPNLAIDSPSSSGSYSTSSATVVVSGTASDNVSVAAVTWSNDRGGSGTAAGTTAWIAANIPLQSGNNVITVTAHDLAGNTSSATVMVTTTLNGIPAAGSYVRPGTVGFLGDPTTLTQYLQGGAAPANCSWQSYGLRCDQDDLALDHVHIKGGLYWTGAGSLTISNSLIEGGDSWYVVYAAATANNAGAQMTITDSTLRWALDSTEPAGQDVGPFWTRGTQTLIVQRCDISGTPQGIDPGEGSLIEDNWIHDLFQNNPASNPTHLDGVFSQGGGNITIQRNYIDVPTVATTAALFIQDSGGTDVGIKIYANYLNGGAYILRNQTGIAVDVVNNTFGTGVYGDVGDITGYPGTYGTWSGNAHVDGTVVPVPN
jgi:hypothetical protein